MKTNSFIAAMLASLVSCMAASTAFAEPIGAAVRIVNKVTGEIDQRQRALKANDPVNQNEAIEVAADSLGELKLNDDTKLALGPGSRMVLDKFVYDPAPSTGTVSVNLLTGAFRFITGLSRKGNYRAAHAVRLHHRARHGLRHLRRRRRRHLAAAARRLGARLQCRQPVRRRRQSVRRRAHHADRHARRSARLAGADAPHQFRHRLPVRRHAAEHRRHAAVHAHRRRAEPVRQEAGDAAGPGARTDADADHADQTDDAGLHATAAGSAELRHHRGVRAVHAGDAAAGDRLAQLYRRLRRRQHRLRLLDL